MWAQIFRSVTKHAIDRNTHIQTDRRIDRYTESPWQYRALHYMQSHGEK